MSTEYVCESCGDEGCKWQQGDGPCPNSERPTWCPCCGDDDCAEYAARWESKAERDALAKRVEELESLFQATHGCHWSWVTEGERLRSMIRELEERDAAATQYRFGSCVAYRFSEQLWASDDTSESDFADYAEYDDDGGGQLRSLHDTKEAVIARARALAVKVE